MSNVNLFDMDLDLDPLIYEDYLLTEDVNSLEKERIDRWIETPCCGGSGCISCLD